MFGFNKYKLDFKKDNQVERIFKVLDYYSNKEVNAWKLSYNAKVLHYTECIRKLRKKGYLIENRIEWKGKVAHSFYKLIK